MIGCIVCLSFYAGALLTALVALLVLVDYLTYKPFALAAKRKRTLGHTKWDAKKLPTKPIDAVVIGSGMGGLSCAATLAQMGHTVVVFECHEVTGGGTHCFAVDGKTKWKFDSGLHYTIPYSEEILQVCAGAARPPVKVSLMGEADGVYDRILLGGSDIPELRIINDVKLLEDLKARYPGHVEVINQYTAVSQQVLIRFPMWCASALLPYWLRRKFLASFIMAPWRKWAAKTAREGLEELIPGEDDESNQLKALLSGLWLDSGCVPNKMSFFMQAATSLGFPHEGGAYPDGGPEAMNLALVESIEAHGGAVFIKSPVETILVEKGRACGVRLCSGDEIRAGKVISATGYRNTMKNLVPAAAREVFSIDVGELQTKQSAGFVMANVAIEGSAAELGLGCSNLWVQPSCPDNNFNVFKGIEDFLAAPTAVPADQIPMLITFPSVKDRKWAEEHPGYECGQILALAEWDWFKQHLEENPWAHNAPPHVQRKDPEGYEALKAKWSDRLEEELFKYYPQLKGKVAFMNISTPLTIEHYLRSDGNGSGGGGGAIGLDVTPQRFTSESEIRQLNMKSPLPDLWLTGQDVLLCGVPLAQASGLITAAKIMGLFGSFRFTLRAARLLLASKLAARAAKSAANSKLKNQ